MTMIIFYSKKERVREVEKKKSKNNHFRVSSVCNTVENISQNSHRVEEKFALSLSFP